eukprot:CAMPEP_0201895398 /NCGR_PEP_ID=MMETSP0902-20130614/42580_1 /ASSEMBLY_ACC=CAM_ASM_000551 /TAXON_ID=420261 /ORGANISM="Thalassiosira antarctica, Strain CCMP982" /LENGTH=215 /DNA_ID=CAMNT_0048427709 /DNA_START=280 /DNA_END=924 /DNA_ORIENTATION=+
MPIRKSGSLDAAMEAQHAQINYLNNTSVLAVDEEDLEDIANMLMELPPTLRQLRGSVTADIAAETAGGSSVFSMDDDDANASDEDGGSDDDGFVGIESSTRSLAPTNSIEEDYQKIKSNSTSNYGIISDDEDSMHALKTTTAKPSPKKSLDHSDDNNVNDDKQGDSNIQLENQDESYRPSNIIEGPSSLETIITAAKSFLPIPPLTPPTQHNIDN